MGILTATTRLQSAGINAQNVAITCRQQEIKESLLLLNERVHFRIFISVDMYSMLVIRVCEYEHLAIVNNYLQYNGIECHAKEMLCVGISE